MRLHVQRDPVIYGFAAHCDVERNSSITHEVSILRVSRDRPRNKHDITMEWIFEGAGLSYIGTLISVVTFVEAGSAVSGTEYLVSAAGLFVLLRH